MPGIFGIYAKSQDFDRQTLRPMAEKMAAAMRHTPWLRTELWGDDRFFGGRITLGVFCPEPQPISSSDGLCQLLFEGEVFRTDSQTPEPPDADSVRQMLADQPHSGMVELDGAFQLALYDSEHHNLTLCVDRFALRPLYYLETPKYFAFAAEPKALLAIAESQPDIDQVSLREYLAFGWILSDRSWWKGIRAFPAASVWTVPTESEPRRYWSSDDIRVSKREETDVIDELETIWQLEVRRRIRPGQMPFLLSGGVDSRIVLSTLVASGADLRAITFGDAGSSDLTISRQCARKAGIEQDILVIDQDNWWHGREEALWRIDGMVSAMHLHAVTSVDYGRIGNQSTLVNLAGNPLFAGDFITPNAAGPWPCSLTDVLGTFYRENPWVSLEEIVDSSGPDLEDDLCGPSSTCFWLRRRTARFTINGPLSTACHYESSFVSPTLQLLDCVLGGVPDNRRRRGKFYAHWAMRHHANFFANIPWQKTDRGMRESLVTRYCRIASQTFNRVTPKRRPRKGIAQYQQLAYSKVFDRRAERRDWLIDDLLDGRASRFMDQQKERFTKPQLTLALWSLELYLRQVAGSVNDVVHPNGSVTVK